MQRYKDSITKVEFVGQMALIDTMKDLFVNFIGAVIFSVIGFFYVKYRGKNKFAEQFIPQIYEDNTVQKCKTKSKSKHNKAHKNKSRVK